MRWFLVIFLKVVNAGGAVVLPQPYDTAEACKAAAAGIVAGVGSVYSGGKEPIQTTLCVPFPQTEGGRR